jgi:large subunit ribosomal protein L28
MHWGAGTHSPGKHPGYATVDVHTELKGPLLRVGPRRRAVAVRQERDSMWAFRTLQRLAPTLPTLQRLAPIGSTLTSFVRHLPTMKRRFRGLYGGKHIQFGNQISFSHRKTRRTWKPNVQYKRFWSETYQRFLRFRVTTSVIKQVNRLKNGIDEYIKTTPNSELLYPKAIKMKRNMRWHDKQRARNEALAAMEEASSAAAAS